MNSTALLCSDFSCNGCLKIADLGLSRIFLNDGDLKTDKDVANDNMKQGVTDKESKRKIRQRQYSHQVATRWYRYYLFS